MIFGVGAPKFVYRKDESISIISVSTGSDELTLGSDHNVVVGDRLTFGTTGTLPSPLSASTYYWVIAVDVNDIQIATTRTGTAIDITSTGSGTHTANPEVTVLIDYWKMLKNEPDPDRLMNQSKISGKRSYVQKGDHWVLEGHINLYKYNDPQSKLEELAFYKGKEITLWLHRDGNQFKNNDGDDCPFILDELEPFYLTTIDYQDAVRVKLISLEYVDLYDSTYDISVQADEVVMSDGE